MTAPCGSMSTQNRPMLGIEHAFIKRYKYHNNVFNFRQYEIEMLEKILALMITTY